MHYAITIDRLPRRVSDRDASALEFLVTRDDGLVRGAAVVLTGQSRDLNLHDVGDEAAWRAAITYAAREIDILCQDPEWITGSDPVLIEAPGLTIRPLIGERSAGFTYELGALVATFEV